jgi:Radial spokehead-like protein
LEAEQERWNVRKYGDQQIFNDSNDTAHNYGVHIIKSLTWEGAHTLVVPCKK